MDGKLARAATLLVLAGMLAGWVALAAYAAWPACKQWWAARAAQGYVPVPAQVDKVVLETVYTGKKNKQPRDVLQVRYRYQYGARSYTSQRVFLVASVAPEAAHRTQYQRLLQAQYGEISLQAWVDPADPQQSVLVREEYDVTILLATALLMVSALAALLAVMARNRRRRRAAGARLSARGG